MRIALVSSEVVGFAKTGGLADVAGALPPALETLGEEVVVFLPMYHCIRKTGNFESTKVRFQIPLGPKLVPGSLAKSKIPGSNVTIYLVENPDLFERDNPAYGRGFINLLVLKALRKITQIIPPDSISSIKLYSLLFLSLVSGLMLFIGTIGNQASAPYS